MTQTRSESRHPHLASLTPDGAHFIDFARRWVPYGGPPAEEIFERFGMARKRFNRAVWESLTANKIELQAAAFRAYTVAYPSPSANTYIYVRDFPGENESTPAGIPHRN